MRNNLITSWYSPNIGSHKHIVVLCGQRASTSYRAQVYEFIASVQLAAFIKDCLCIRWYLRQNTLPFQTMHKHHASLKIIIIIYVNYSISQQYVILTKIKYTWQGYNYVYKNAPVPIVRSNDYGCLTSQFCNRSLRRLDLTVTKFARFYKYLAIYKQWSPSSV